MKHLKFFFYALSIEFSELQEAIYLLIVTRGGRFLDKIKERATPVCRSLSLYYTHFSKSWIIALI